MGRTSHLKAECFSYLRLKCVVTFTVLLVILSTNSANGYLCLTFR